MTISRIALPRTLLTLLLALMLGTAASASLSAQSSADDAYALARKRLASLKGLKGEDRRKGQEDALTSFGLVVEKFPDATEEVARARYEMAGLERRLGRPERAMTLLADIEGSAGPARIRAKALDLSARIARAQGKADLAENQWRALIDRHPGQTRLVGEARLSIAKLAKKLKQWKKARVETETLLAETNTGWRLAVDASDFLVGLYVARRDWTAARAKLTEVESTLRGRYGDGEGGAKLEAALAKMSARKVLTPIPEGD